MNDPIRYAHVYSGQSVNSPTSRASLKIAIGSPTHELKNNTTPILSESTLPEKIMTTTHPVKHTQIVFCHLVDGVGAEVVTDI